MGIYKLRKVQVLYSLKIHQTKSGKTAIVVFNRIRRSCFSYLLYPHELQRLVLYHTLPNCLKLQTYGLPPSLSPKNKASIQLVTGDKPFSEANFTLISDIGQFGLTEAKKILTYIFTDLIKKLEKQLPLSLSDIDMEILKVPIRSLIMHG